MFSTTIFRISNESGPRRRLRLRRSLRLLEKSVTEMVAFLVAKKVKSPWVFTIQKTKKKRKLELCWLFFLLVLVRISENWLDSLDCFECLFFPWIGRKFGLLVDSSVQGLDRRKKKHSRNFSGWGWLDLRNSSEYDLGAKNSKLTTPFWGWSKCFKKKNLWWFHYPSGFFKHFENFF